MRIGLQSCARAALAALLIVGGTGTTGAQIDSPSGAGALAAKPPMNVLLILTDDQRFDTVSRMPNLSTIASQGVTFTSAYMPSPLCGPSRAMLFSGGYREQNTGVLENALPDGGATVFNDRGNLGAALQAAGYRTEYVGKWVNGYEGMGKYIPPGWTKWVGRHSYSTITSWQSFEYTSGTSGQNPGVGTIANAQQYTTYFERDQVLNFLSSTPAAQPFFVLWAPSAPHGRATGAPEDLGLFTDYVYRGRSYGEADLSDKPSWVRNSREPDNEIFVRHQLQSLQSVDRSIVDVIARLKSLGRFNNTVIIFTSDNGYMWGEHGQWGKDAAYEESMRVPFIVLMPGVAPRTEASLVLPSLDLGPTIFELAGVSRKTDGTSLVPLLKVPGQPWRTDFFFEKTTSAGGGPAIWAGVRDGRWKYVRYWNGEEELYDLNADPYELVSRHKDSTLSALKASLLTRTQQQLGLAILPKSTLPNGSVGTPFSFPMKTWGGKAPFSWTVTSGQLPPGLTLNPSSGVIQGVPNKSGTYQFSVRITDSVVATQTGKPRTFVTRPIKLIVKA